MLKRSSGILLHVSSLNGKYGIGDFGQGAYEFIDFLKRNNQKLWQILPLGITGYGDSPYQSFSAFAGNPYFIDLDEFLNENLIKEDDLKELKKINEEEKVNYEKLFIEKYKVLKKAYVAFKEKKDMKELEKHKNKYSKWLPEYALFMALKNNFNGVSWQEWPRNFKLRDKKSLKIAKKELSDEINFYIFLEYYFRNQWDKLKKYANENGVKIVGDIPIFVATDSSDTWLAPEMYQFDKKLKPKRVAGCPPDAFSEDGQLWGNVLYNWKAMKKENYAWWVERVRDSFKLYDVVRIDHFRGFDSYWSIPALDKTARNGKWKIGPGIDLFRVIKEKLGEVDIIAEDLGFLTPRVRKLLRDSGYPGMKIFEFAFGEDENNENLPTNISKNTVVYTGTHDNQTFLGWYKSAPTLEQEFCVNYLAKYLDKKESEILKDVVFNATEALWKSNAIISIIPMQDLLNLGNEARMNTPSTLGNNWNWRLRADLKDENLGKELAKITKMYKR